MFKKIINIFGLKSANIMNILIVPDKFKGSLTAAEAAKAMADGIREAYNNRPFNNTPLNIQLLPMADGGDGSLDIVEQQFGGKRIGCRLHDPLGRVITAYYLLKGDEAFIEMAAISGLELLKAEERNPLLTSTYGLGEAIKDACERGAKKISLSIGGSATNDCGAGMLQALGMTAVQKSGAVQKSDIITGGDLQSVESVNLSAVQEFTDHYKVTFRVICDVDNPLLGPDGATYIYSGQKGADKGMQELLESGVRHFAQLTDQSHNKGCMFAGAGAAGGVGYALHALLGAELVRGSRFFADLNNLEEMVQRSDMVFTGEGCLDEQSFNGKVIGTVLESCRRYKKRLYILCGISRLQNAPCNTKVFTLSTVSLNMQDSIENAHEYLRRITCDIFSDKIAT